MQIVTTFDELATQLNGRRSCLTIGVFDGVHQGHQALLRETVRMARETSATPVALTFRNHPLSVLAPPYRPKRLITAARKADLLRHLGIEILLLIDFTAEFAAIPPEIFISDFLVKKAAIQNLVCGYDFTFGNHGAGNIAMLEQMGTTLDFQVTSLDAVSQQNMAVKSTHIRDLLSTGKITKAAELLTRPHELPGKIISGQRRGRTIGFPTANMKIPEHYQTPAGGVYVCGARVGSSDKILPAMVNIGVNPTFGENQLSVEAYILDFDEDIHGQILSLYFLQWLRDEQKFPGVGALVNQLNIDKARTSAFWKTPEAQDERDRIPGAVEFLDGDLLD